MEKIHTATIVKRDLHLGKIKYKWKFPIDLIIKARKIRKTLIGVGQWYSSNKKYVCIVPKEDVVYLSQEAVENLLKQLKSSK